MAERKAGGEQKGGQLVPAAIGSGLLLDLADLVTFGPIGLWAGAALGLLLGWSLAPQLGFASRRWLPAALSGLYFTTPGTALLPLAGLLAAVRSLTARARAAAPQPAAPSPDVARRQGGDAIEADYVSRWHDDPDAGSD